MRERERERERFERRYIYFWRMLTFVYSVSEDRVSPLRISSTRMCGGSVRSKQKSYHVRKLRNYAILCTERERRERERERRERNAHALLYSDRPISVGARRLQPANVHERCGCVKITRCIQQLMTRVPVIRGTLVLHEMGQDI